MTFVSSLTIGQIDGSLEITPLRQDALFLLQVTTTFLTRAFLSYNRLYVWGRIFLLFLESFPPTPYICSQYRYFTRLHLCIVIFTSLTGAGSGLGGRAGMLLSTARERESQPHRSMTHNPIKHPSLTAAILTGFGLGLVYCSLLASWPTALPTRSLLPTATSSIPKRSSSRSSVCYRPSRMPRPGSGAISLPAKRRIWSHTKPPWG